MVATPGRGGAGADLARPVGAVDPGADAAPGRVLTAAGADRRRPAPGPRDGVPQGADGGRAGRIPCGGGTFLADDRGRPGQLDRDPAGSTPGLSRGDATVGKRTQRRPAVARLVCDFFDT